MRSITVAGTNLFKIAASTFGDATLWVYFAELNQIRDPFLPGVAVINVPSASSLQGGGIVGQ